MRDFEKRQTLRRLWMERPAKKRTEADLISFYEWIAENFPSLLPRGRDSFEQMKAELTELYERRAS